MVNKFADETVNTTPVADRHFRLLSMPCCKRQLEWIDPRLPNYCPECSAPTFWGVEPVDCMLYEDKHATLIMHVKRGPSKPVEAKQRLGSNSRTGMKVRYVPNENDDSRAAFGSNVNPKGLLSTDCEYVVEHVEVHSWHTKIWLENNQGPFNSTHFVLA